MSDLRTVLVVDDDTSLHEAFRRLRVLELAAPELAEITAEVAEPISMEQEARRFVGRGFTQLAASAPALLSAPSPNRAQRRAAKYRKGSRR